MCILGEPTESKVVLGHFGSLWLRISTHGPVHPHGVQRGEARPELDRAHARRARRACSSGSRRWEDDPANAYRGAKAIVNVGAIEGGFGWRVSRTPHRTDLFLDVRVPPTKEMAVARARGARHGARLAERFPDYGIEGEVYVTAPGAEIDEGHPLVGALDEAHAEVFGAAPERDVTRWFSDASVLTRYGIATVNYGTSTRAARHREGREPRDRRAREDRRGLRARRDEGLRGRVSRRTSSACRSARARSTTARPTISSGSRCPSSCSTRPQGRSTSHASASSSPSSTSIPRTGTPGRPTPDGWDAIPGARGCTPQSCAFRDHAAELAELGARVAGLSAQPLERSDRVRRARATCRSR